MPIPASDFYQITQDQLNGMVATHGIRSIDDYYSSTDEKLIPDLLTLADIPRTFAQIALHGQNATMMSNIIKFKDNYLYIKELTRNFTPSDFIDAYPGGVNDILAKIKRDGVIRWSSSKSSKKPDAIVLRFTNILWDAAQYLKSFSSKKDVLRDLHANYGGDFEKLIKYFRSKMSHGFRVALTCDFLKEYDKSFSDFSKPDTHLKDVMGKYSGKKFSGVKGDYDCIAVFKNLVDDINMGLPKVQQITAYKLDRMIWLICSGDFFLDGSPDEKSGYLSKI